MHDIDDIERRGIPAVMIASAPFEDAAQKQADALGLNVARVFVPHPIQDRTDEELVDVQPENTISPAKIDRHKKRMISDVDYREKIEERINALISKIETKELTLDDLTENDRQVIIDIMNQNG